MQRLEARADLDCLERMHTLFDALWEEAPAVEQMERMRFMTAVAEIVANVVEHGSTADGNKPALVLELQADDDRLYALVEDDGVAFDGQPPAADDWAEGGRGIDLARAAVDSVAYEYAGGRNRWDIVLATKS